MIHRTLPWLLPFALLACGDDSNPPEGESSTGGSASTGSDTSTGTTQASLSGSQTESDSESGLSSGSTDDPSSSTFEPSTGEPSTGEPSTGEPSTGSDTDSSGSSGSDTGEPGTSSSTGALACDITEVVENAAMGKTDPVDCGFVQLADPLDEWEAAQTCVLDNFGNDTAFTVVAELQGIDSEVFIGYAGMVGESYVASQFFSDSFGGVTIYGTTPCNIAAVAGCTVAVGDLCLECVDPPDSDVVCQA